MTICFDSGDEEAHNIYRLVPFVLVPFVTILVRIHWYFIQIVFMIHLAVTTELLVNLWSK